MANYALDLHQMGWGHFFQQQLSIEELESCSLARVAGVNRNLLSLITEEGGLEAFIPGNWYLNGTDALPTVGDWLLLDEATGQPLRLLERKSFLHRKAAGRESKIQALASNIDTLFIVTSCNDDFNPSRIERYLTLALGCEITPVLVITKSDLVSETDSYLRQAQDLSKDMAVHTVNALDAVSVSRLHFWCGTGQTIALAGSSGVGKSTLVNTLSSLQVQSTGSIRDDDSKGRHTTTERSLHFLPMGCVLIDTPGIRELQLSDCREGLACAFDDIESLAMSCRFNDCSHEHESGCAVLAAVQEGGLDMRRLTNYRKILREQERNSRTIAQRRSRDKKFGKMCREVMAVKHSNRKR